jgi:hypothetical protein
MQRIYTHLNAQERAIVMTMRDDQCSIRIIAKRLGRAPSSISRELRRAPGYGAYDANLAHLQSGARRTAPRRLPRTNWMPARCHSTRAPEKRLVGRPRWPFMPNIWPDYNCRPIRSINPCCSWFLRPPNRPVWSGFVCSRTGRVLAGVGSVRLHPPDTPLRLYFRAS